MPTKSLSSVMVSKDTLYRLQRLRQDLTEVNRRRVTMDEVVTNLLDEHDSESGTVTSDTSDVAS